MNIDVYDLCHLYVEGSEDMKIWCAFDAEDGGDGIVFEGTFDEAMHSDFASCEVDSFGIECGILVVNIS